MDDVDVDGVAGSDIRLWLMVELDAKDPRREGEGDASGVDGTSERLFGLAVVVVDDRAERGFVVVVGEGGTATEVIVVVGPIERGRGFVALRVVVLVGLVVVETIVLARRVTAAVGSGAGGEPLLLAEMADIGLIPSSASVDRLFAGCCFCCIVGAFVNRDAIFNEGYQLLLRRKKKKSPTS